jgi:hypothetical protein
MVAELALIKVDVQNYHLRPALKNCCQLKPDTNQGVRACL